MQSSRKHTEKKLKKDSQLKIIDKIERLMRDRNVSQMDIHKAAGIPQSKLSVGLNRYGTTNFSIDNICAIADYFGVSVDYLLGRKKNTTSDVPLNEELCKELMCLIESGTIRAIDVDVNEDTYQPYFGPDDDYPYPYEYVNKKSRYKMLYFSNYASLPASEELPEPEMDEVMFDCQTQGNDNPKGREINEFIEFYLKFYDLLQHNNLSKEMYETAIQDRLSAMKY